MRFAQTAVEGVRILDLEGHQDARGYFARMFCGKLYAEAGITMQVDQVNLSQNPRKGTLRGLHYQANPNGEDKVVQCVRGRLFDVAVDLRPDSPSFRCWVGVELAPDLHRALFIPRGCAHGFVTLADDTDIVYLMGQAYVPGGERGVRWNDPAFGIAWPIAPLEMSSRDADYPDFGAES
jgi:dTDP-4-dehydrorhamnose 3,5-epimerase